MTKSELKALVDRVKKGLVVTKVVATRSVKGTRGDTFVGFSAAWNSVQEDGGQGLVTSLEEESQTVTAMTMEEAIVASIILAREADTAAYRNAAAGGNISPELATKAVTAIRANYNKALLQAFDLQESQERHDK